MLWPKIEIEQGFCVGLDIMKEFSTVDYKENMYIDGTDVVIV